MTHEEIYKLYRKTDYDKPKLLQVLADVCSITVENLKQIIKDGDEKSMPKGTRWTDEQHKIYDRMTAENAKSEDIAKALGLPLKAVHSKRSNDKAKLKCLNKPEGKPAIINKDFDDLFDSNTTYAECDLPDVDNGEDAADINQKIRDLCELPDPPKPKPDYTESLLETLREAIEFNEPVVYFVSHEPEPQQEPRKNRIHTGIDFMPKREPPKPKQRTVFDEAHAALWSLESMAKRIGIKPCDIVLKINLDRIIAETLAFGGYDAVSINKKNPLANVAASTSGE